MEQQTEVQQKTRTHISQMVGIGVVTAFGALGAAAFMLFGTTKPLTTKQIVSITSPSTTTTKDLTNAALPTKEMLADNGVPATVTSGTVSVVITSPKEGAAVNGDASLSVSLNDPNHEATAVRVLLYGDLLPAYMQGVSLGIKTTAPYAFSSNLGMYKSGEYRYVAQAVKPNTDPNRTDDWTVVASTDTMVTWVRSCYWLAYQDMTLTAPTAPVVAGKSFTLTGTLKNPNRGNCPHIYDLTTSNPIGMTSWLPAGWTGTITPTQMSLGINETKTFSVTITVPSTATAGTYSVGVSSKLQYTGFIVSPQVNVNVVTSGGGGRLPGQLPD